MCALVQKKINIGGIPVQRAQHEPAVFREHLKESRAGETECFHICDCLGGNGLFDLENRPVKAWENSSFSVKRRDLARAVFVLQSGHGSAGYDIVNMSYGVTVIPQILIFAEDFYSVRLSEEIFIEIPVVIGKIVAGNQHKRHLLSLGCFHHSIEKERLQSGGKEQHLYEKM